VSLTWPMPVHLRPSAPTAPRAILCGDPARALAIAQEVLTAPRMSNHHRGLWGYHGETALGMELTVQATGIGGPSAVVVLDELAALGVREAIRVGTCRSSGGAAHLGAPLVVGSARALDGTSAALGVERGTELECDPELTGALAAALASEPRLVASADVYPAAGAPGRAPELRDLQSAAVLAAGARHGLRVGVALAVAIDESGPLDDAPMEAALLRLGSVAAESLSALAADSPAPGV